MKKILFILFVLIMLLGCSSKNAEPRAETQTELKNSIAKFTELTGDVLLNGQTARPGDKIFTGDIILTNQGQATIVFDDSSEIRLDEQTKLAIDDIQENKVLLSQDVGSSWTKLLKVTGIHDYQISTPNTVATVRGTGFGVIVDNEQTEVMVDEGEVMLAASDGSDQQILFEDDHAVMNKKAKKMIVKAMQKDSKKAQWMRNNIGKDEKLLDKLSEKMVKMHKEGMSRQEMKHEMKQYLMGKVDKDQLVQRGVITKNQARNMPQGTNMDENQIRKIISDYRNDKVIVSTFTDEAENDLREINIMIKDLEELSSLI